MPRSTNQGGTLVALGLAVAGINTVVSDAHAIDYIWGGPAPINVFVEFDSILGLDDDVDAFSTSDQPILLNPGDTVTWTFFYASLPPTPAAYNVVSTALGADVDTFRLKSEEIVGGGVTSEVTIDLLGPCGYQMVGLTTTVTWVGNQAVYSEDNAFGSLLPPPVNNCDVHGFRIKVKHTSEGGGPIALNAIDFLWEDATIQACFPPTPPSGTAVHHTWGTAQNPVTATATFAPHTGLDDDLDVYSTVQEPITLNPCDTLTWTYLYPDGDLGTAFNVVSTFLGADIDLLRLHSPNTVTNESMRVGITLLGPSGQTYDNANFTQDIPWNGTTASYSQLNVLADQTSAPECDCRIYGFELLIMHTGGGTAAPIELSGIDFLWEDETLATCDPPTAACLAADFDASCWVDVDDLFYVIAGWGPCFNGCDDCISDLDENCQTDIDDLFVVIGTWGPCS